MEQKTFLSPERLHAYIHAERSDAEILMNYSCLVAGVMSAAGTAQSAAAPLHVLEDAQSCTTIMHKSI